MTRPINLFVQSRIEGELPFNRVASHSSRKNKRARVKSHEILSLRRLVDGLMDFEVTVKDLDGFFYGYSIPQIGKEFDLLKFNQKQCLSIELKSRAVSRRKIFEQIKKNAYYLRHLAKEVKFFTVVTDSMTVYKLDGSGKLVKAEFSELVKEVKAFSGEYTDDLDGLFKISAFLVSPLASPQRFLNGEYFLTTAQQQRKREMLRVINKSKGATFLSITGRSGTGKTLLLYDLAKELSKGVRAVIIHGAVLGGKFKGLNNFTDMLKLVDIEEIAVNNRLIDGYKYFFVDESQRISPQNIQLIAGKVREANGVCVFSFDVEQTVTKQEAGYNIAETALRLCENRIFNLSERIRTNKSLSAFIGCLKDLKKRAPKDVDFSEVSLCYADQERDCRRLVEYFEGEGFVFIDYSNIGKSLSKNKPIDARFVVGMEFEKVVMLMDEAFYYDESGILCGAPQQSSEYLYTSLFYQGITRARERLAIIVVNNSSLFSKITSIVDRMGEKRKNG